MRNFENNPHKFLCLKIKTGTQMTAVIVSANNLNQLDMNICIG